MSKPKLYIDFDNTMVNSCKRIVDMYNEDFMTYDGFRPINYMNVTSWEFKECNLATRDQINWYFNTPRFFEKIECMEYLVPVLSELSYKFDFVIVSHGNKPNLRLKELWLDRNFNTFIGGFEDGKINHANVKFIGVDWEKYSDKSHIDMSDGIFIDDSTTNLRTSNAKHKILFGEQKGWNKDSKGEFVRCENWLDVYVGIARFQSLWKE